jgi:rRNA maturation RNase YbeY
MARVNASFLQHEGSTDIITFDHLESAETGELHGELFICLDDAMKQAKEFKTSWQSELTRYVIHGLLHLRGHDDREAAARRTMKKEENRLLREASRMFSLPKLARN